ncbi:MAG: thiamine phosphate synthase, partial [Pseudomonadota bacterium]|nr:thiamine phosphate synthase [Pseudomonadota bacterium]
MNLRGIYAITDDTLLANRNITASIESALQAGISMLQYRTKSELNGLQLEQICQILDLCRQHSVPLIINDDVTLCKDIGAQGVHLGHEDENLRAARITLGAEAIIGVTCHDSLQAAVAAEKAG